MRNQFRRLHSAFNSDQQALELCEQFLVLAPTPLDGSLRGEAEVEIAPARLAYDPMMNDRIPDQIHIQEWTEVMSGACFSPPRLEPCGVENRSNLMRRAVLGFIRFKQIAQIFDYLIAYLHSQALFVNGLEQCSQHQLATISIFVASEIRTNASDSVPGHKGTVGAHHHVIQVIAHRQLFTQRRLIELFFVVFPSHWHYCSSSRM